jgi:hypothetical protein
VGLRRLETVIERSQGAGALFGDDDSAGQPIGRIGATLDQAGSFEIVEEVRHDRAVDSGGPVTESYNRHSAIPDTTAALTPEARTQT